LSPPSASGPDRQIADTFSSYFANFIRTGDPNGKGLAHWPSTAEQPGTTTEIGDKYVVIPVAGDKEKLAFFEAYLTRPRTPAPGR
jgi:para-nitrobenzyl esterase